MRDAFAAFMTRTAKERQDVCLLSGDIGNRMFDKYKDVAPERFFNCGIAEANMMSLAAGIALSGLRPFVYTITPFTTTRCLEQIKVGVCYQNTNVVIVGTGSGLSYSELGATHHSFEDIAIIRSLPGIRIYSPADRVELEGILRESIEEPGPTYIRLGKKGEQVIHSEDTCFKFGRAQVMGEGTDILILSSGPLVSETMEARKILAVKGISAGICNIGSVKPLDDGLLEDMAKRYRLWISVEEHSVIGGVGTSLLEWLNEHGCNNSLVRLGIRDEFLHELGDQTFMRARLGIDRVGIARRAEEILAGCDE